MKFSFDTWLILIWILLASVLVIENMVLWMIWYLFLDSSANVWIIILVAVFIWISIWYWFRWNLSKKSWYDEENEYDF